MGGYGSGAYGSGVKLAKTTTGQCKSIDIRKWQRQNALSAPHFTTSWINGKGKETGSINVIPKADRVVLTYRLNDEPRKDTIYYNETKTGFGTRKWFVCPGCGDRCAVLYFKGKHFACRKCHELNYRSSQLSGDMAYYHRQLENLCNQLGAEYDPIGHFPPWKPKGMHWKTYEKHVARFRELAYKRDRLFIAGAQAVIDSGKKHLNK